MISYSDNKAGLSGVDKEHIQRIIAENSGAKYSSFSKKKLERIEHQAKAIKDVLDRATPKDWQKADKKMKEAADKLETARILDRDCVHIDMDMFYAAVEMRDEPRLRSVPMAVGGDSMLSTANYIARKYGIRSGMPGFIAKKLCPKLEVVPVNFHKYRKESAVFSNILTEYDPNMEMGSLDEAYLNISEYVRERTDPKNFLRLRYGGECACRLPLIPPEEITKELDMKIETCEKCGKERVTYADRVEFGIGRAEIVRELRFRVEQATGLTCSAGIAANFRLAKICSDMNKPNGQFELENDREKILAFLEDLPIRKVNGIGAVGEAHLKACGIETVGELRRKIAAVGLVFSSLAQESYLCTALGISGRHRDSDPQRKSISVERTFKPTADATELREIHSNICEMLVKDLARAEIIGGKTLSIKLKLATFDVLTRAHTADKVISSIEDIKQISSELLSKELGPELRLLGVRLSNLVFAQDNVQEDGKKKKKTMVDFLNDANERNERKRKRTETSDIEDEEGDIEFLETIDVVEEVERQKPLQEEEQAQAQQPSTSKLNETKAEDGVVECPICGQLLNNDNRTVNRHLDTCLNREFMKTKRCEPTSTKEAEAKKENAKPAPKQPSSSRKSANKVTKTSSAPKKNKKSKPQKQSKSIAEYFNKS